MAGSSWQRRQSGNPLESPQCQAVMASLWSHRRTHNWQPGMVWDVTAWRPGAECGCKKPCGAYVWPGGRREGER
jgi:hypothetical protein